MVKLLSIFCENIVGNHVNELIEINCSYLVKEKKFLIFSNCLNKNYFINNFQN